MRKVYVPDAGRDAKVNWYRDGKLGLSYLDKNGNISRLSGGNAECAVKREDEVEFKYGKIKTDSEKESLSKKSPQELREHLRKVREEARALTNAKRKKTRKKNASRRKSVPKTPEEIANSLSEEEKKAIKNLLSSE